MTSDNHHFFFAGPEPRLFAHRGASAVAPENTLEAFRLARELGVRYLELDVHLSADREAIVIHDNSVSRTTGRRGRVEKMTVAALRKLDAGYTFSPDHGRTFPYRGRGVTIPTLDDVLAAFPGMRFTIEIKKTLRGIEEVLAGKLDRHEATERVIVASADHDVLQRFRERAPSVTTSFSKDEVRDFLGRLRSGDLNGYRPPGKAFQVPEYNGLRRVVSKPVIDAVHGLGVEVHVWTVNEPLHISRLLGWGVDGIMTDDPGRAFASVDALRHGSARRGDGRHAS